MSKITKPIDLSKFRKGITKNIKGISCGFNDPSTWIDTGNYCLNYLISNDFKKGIPLEGKFTLIAGDSGSGKSYLASGNLVKSAQEQGIFPILIDSENALDETWLQALGVKTSDDDLMKINCSMIDDVAKFVGDFVREYKAGYSGIPLEERPKVLFVIDSLGMMLTPTDKAQYEKGDMKGDMGRKAKQITALCRNIVAQIASENIGLIATNHTYASADMFNPDDVIAGGKGLEYASSIILCLNRRKLKEDSEGNKTSQVHGIRAAANVRKSRYNKPFEKVELYIPYATGLDRYSGLFDFALKAGILTKVGNRYKYVDSQGEEHLDFKKRLKSDFWDMIINEWEAVGKRILTGQEPLQFEEDE